jgi:hypothetical protein
VAFANEVCDHATAHDAKTDESNVRCHAGSIS